MRNAWNSTYKIPLVPAIISPLSDLSRRLPLRSRNTPHPFSDLLTHRQGVRGPGMQEQSVTMHKKQARAWARARARARARSAGTIRARARARAGKGAGTSTGMDVGTGSHSYEGPKRSPMIQNFGATSIKATPICLIEIGSCNTQHKVSPQISTKHTPTTWSL